jgi:hypothetical protein
MNDRLKKSTPGRFSKVNAYQICRKWGGHYNYHNGKKTKNNACLACNGLQYRYHAVVMNNAANTTTLPELNLRSIELDGIDMSDYPDFCDAFISYAEAKDGTPLTDEQLELLNEDTEFVQILAHESFH